MERAIGNRPLTNMMSVQSIAQGVQHPAGTTVAPLWLVVRIMLKEERFLYSELLYKGRSPRGKSIT